MKANQTFLYSSLKWTAYIWVASFLLAAHYHASIGFDSTNDIIKLLFASGNHWREQLVSPSNNETSFVYLPLITGAAANLPTESLLLHYRFEGNSMDSSGHANHGAEFGGVSYVDGKLGLAAKFDGVNDYIRRSNPPILQHLSSTFTITFWIKPEGSQNSGVIDIGKENKETWEIYHNKQLTGYVQNWNRPQTEVFPYTVPTPLHVWTFITFVYEDKHFSAFVNGIEVAEFEFNHNPIIDDDEWIEVGVNAPGGDEYFKGQLDEIRMYGRALQDSEIQALFNEGN